MKKNRIILWILLIVVVSSLVGFITYKILNDKNKLTSEERTWINNNINVVQNINIVKDENLFSVNGSGVFYSFLSDFEKEYGLKINYVSTDDNNAESNSLIVTNNVLDNNKLFYKDHYVLVSTSNEYINSNEDLEGKTIGVLNSDLEYIKKYLNVTINFTGYDKIEDLLNSNGYIIIPRMKYIDKILSKNYNILYHLDDINIYYVLSLRSTLHPLFL